MNDEYVNESELIPEENEYVSETELVPETPEQRALGNYTMSKADRKRVFGAFSGDPLAFIGNESERIYVNQITENLTDRDEYRKRMALAAYFTAMNRGSDYRFNLANLDGILESFYKRKTTVEKAYADVGSMVNPQQVSVAKEFGKILWDGTVEHGAALGSGAMQTLSGIAHVISLVNKWGNDIAYAAVKPLMSEKQKAFFEAYKKLVIDDIASPQNIYQENQKTIQFLSEKANANPDFIGDLLAGKYDNVSTTDFTKALLRAAPNYAMQALVAMAATPAAVPAYIGATTAAEKKLETDIEHPEWSGMKQISYVGLVAAEEALLDLISTKIMGGGMSTDTAKKNLEKGFAKFLGKSYIEGGAGESLQKLTANGLDYLYEVDGDHSKWSFADKFKYLTRGVLEEGVIGGFGEMGFGVMGFRNAREYAGHVENVRHKHENIVQELSAKENLTAEEEKQLARSQDIIDTADDQALITKDYVSHIVEQFDADEAIRESDDFKNVEKTAAEDTPEETIIKAVRAEHNQKINSIGSWQYQDVADKVTEFSGRFSSDIVFHTLHSLDEARDILPENTPAGARAFTDLSTGDIYINAEKVRPSEVPAMMLHEVVGHKGLRAIIPEKHFDDFLDNVYREHCQDELFTEVAKTYRLGKYVDVDDPEAGDIVSVYTIDDVKNQRLAAEEYIARLAQNDVKPSWWKEFVQKIRMALAKLPLFKDVRMNDRQIETLLARSARAMRKRNGAVRNGTDENGSVRSGTEQNGVRFAAAYRKPGAPNTAENTGVLRDGKVPHAAGFLEHIGLHGYHIYADYEFLRGKHPNYFKTPEEARAAVEFVLDNPETAGIVNGNPAFIRNDVETGDAWRIELRKIENTRQVHVRSAHKLTKAQYKNAASRSDTPEDVRPDRSTVEDGNRPKVDFADRSKTGNTVSDFLRYDSAENADVKPDSEKNLRFSVAPDNNGNAGNSTEKAYSSTGKENLSVGTDENGSVRSGTEQNGVRFAVREFDDGKRAAEAGKLEN